MRMFLAPIKGTADRAAQADAVRLVLEKAAWEANDLPLDSSTAEILQEALELWANTRPAATVSAEGLAEIERALESIENLRTRLQNGHFISEAAALRFAAQTIRDAIRREEEEPCPRTSKPTK